MDSRGVSLTQECCYCLFVWRVGDCGEWRLLSGATSEDVVEANDGRHARRA